MTVFSWSILKRWSNSPETLTNAATGVKHVLGSYLGEGNPGVRLPDRVASYSSPHFEAISGAGLGCKMTVFSRPILNRWSNSPETLTSPVTSVKRVLGSYLGGGNAVVRLPDPVASYPSPHFEALSGAGLGCTMTVFSRPILNRWSNSPETLTIPATGVKHVLGSYLGGGNTGVRLPDRVAPYSSPHFEALSGVWHGGIMTVFLGQS